MSRTTRAPSPPPLRTWACFVFVLLGYWAVMFSHPEWFSYLGIRHYGTWFIDLFAILASNDALAQGLDVYARNPLDFFGRPHVYSAWWLGLGRFGLTRLDNVWLGCVIGSAFFAAAAMRLRPRSLGELLWYLAIAGAPPMLLAVERANNDLVIFLLLTPLVPCLLSTRWALQAVAVLLIALAAGLKFYPAAAALLLLAPDAPRTVRWRLVGAGLALVVVAVAVAPDYLRLRHLLPPVEGLMNFGSLHAFTPFGLGGATVQAITLGVIFATVAGWWRVGIFGDWEIPPAMRAHWLHFILGAVLLCGCFFADSSYAYRWIFALWLAPWLWGVVRETGTPRAVRRVAGLTMGLLAAVLWIDPLTEGLLRHVFNQRPPEETQRMAQTVFAIEQPLVWVLFICLLGFLTHFLRISWRSITAVDSKLASTPGKIMPPSPQP
ncbi:MAG TPA: hypothetical protein VHO24_07450 [Opitutaceae bacterium]|nr:hypothetical protein [Opitutaceae bacterium]